MRTLDSSESESEENIVPIGLSKLSLSKLNKFRPSTVNVMVKKKELVQGEFIPALRYENLLNRADEFLRKNASSQKKRLKLVVTRKNRKTQVNASELAIQLNRQVVHLSKYILRTLFAEGSVNERGVLNIDGRFVQSEIESAVKSFIEMYVICKSCDSIDSTNIVKQNRLFFVKCHKCNAERCVGATIEGFNQKEAAKGKLIE
ncbi:hypothetical protein NUSPORA_01138 [Nucleospora cyclopteri]